ncbi:MAG TPA: hypothetical protein GX501_07850 [Clostridiaceae bacterium]|nr:hypothetical protein [Clostridiaceae bacterium]
MLAVNATDVRKDFGRYIDEIVRVKPIFIKRSRDYFMGISLNMARELVKDVVFTADKYIEDDYSVTLSLHDFDIVMNDSDESSALDSLIEDLKEYALEFYEDIEYWSSDINRRKQLPKILKILLTNDNEELKESIICQVGRS